MDTLKNEYFDVTILDIDMPLKSGIDVLDFLIENPKIKTKSIILTMHNDEMFFNESFNKGTKGFLLKEDSSIEIIECIEKVMLNIPFVSKKLTHFLKNRSDFSKKISTIKGAIANLTNAELNTIKLVSQNKTSKEISELLFVTEKSVENYRSRICKKLNLKGGSNTLYKWCIENKDLIS